MWSVLWHRKIESEIQTVRRLDGSGSPYFSERCLLANVHKQVAGNSLLKKQWFDMILNGIKTEEYREIKPYWTKRFSNYFGQHYDFSGEESEIIWDTQKKIVVFRNGYGKDKPEFSAECTIREGYGKEAWGAEKDVKYYILTIHRVFDFQCITLGK